MSYRDLTLWLNEHRWDALEEALQAEASDIVTHMTQYLLHLYETMVSGEEYNRVEAIIKAEENAEQIERESNRRFSLARVTENGGSTILLLERGEDLFGTALRLRQHLRGESYFKEVYPAAAELTPERAAQYVAEAVNGSPRVVGVYDIDLDQGELSALDINYGWRTYQAKEISTAVYHATKRESADWAEKRHKFYEQVDDMDCNPSIRPVYIRGTEPLPVDAVRFESDIQEVAGRFLNFYIAVHFDPDKVFGTHVETTDNDDWLNVYAEYDMKTGSVNDALEVYLVRGDGTELCCQYRITEEEQAALLPKMDAYCREQLGMGLEACREQYLAEQTPQQSGQTM